MRRCAALLLAFIALTSAPAVRAAEVALIVSGEAEPYRLAVERAVQELGTGVTPHRLGLEAVQRSGLAALPEGAVVVAVGSPAAVWLDTQVSPERRLLYAMVAPEQASALTARCVGLVTAVPAAAQREALGLALPRARRLGMLYSSADARSVLVLAEVRAVIAAGGAEGGELVVEDIQAHQGAGPAITALLGKKPDVVWAMPDSAVYSKPVIVSLLRDSLRFRVPVFGFSEGFVRSGAALGTGIDPHDQGALLATLVKQHIAGGELVAPAAPARLFLNQTVAVKLGLRFPDAAMERAAVVIGGER